jgi:hypothetical protein
MNDIQITKTGLALRDLIPNAVVNTLRDIIREDEVAVSIAVGTAYTRGVTEPEKYPECVKVVQWLRDTTYAGGPEKTWLIIHERLGH